MSGDETVVALVGTIGATFGIAGRLLQLWKTNYTALWKAEHPNRYDDPAQVYCRELASAFEQAVPIIRQEYLKGVINLGEAFMNGDYTGRKRLKEILQDLQGRIISRLKQAIENPVVTEAYVRVQGLGWTKVSLGKGRLDELNYTSLISIANCIRNDARQALAEQYQRIASQTPYPQAPIAASPTELARSHSGQQYCPAALAQQSASARSDLLELACQSCMFGRGSATSYLLDRGIPVIINKKFNFHEVKIKTPSLPQGAVEQRWTHRRYEFPIRFFSKSHLIVDSWRASLVGSCMPIFGCTLCDRLGVVCNFPTVKTLAEHVESKHSAEEYGLDSDIKVIS